jgi:hypothetical protein
MGCGAPFPLWARDCWKTASRTPSPRVNSPKREICGRNLGTVSEAKWQSGRLPRQGFSKPANCSPGAASWRSRTAPAASRNSTSSLCPAATYLRPPADPAAWLVSDLACRVRRRMACSRRGHRCAAGADTGRALRGACGPHPKQRDNWNRLKYIRDFQRPSWIGGEAVSGAPAGWPVLRAPRTTSSSALRSFQSSRNPPVTAGTPRNWFVATDCQAAALPGEERQSGHGGLNCRCLSPIARCNSKSPSSLPQVVSLGTETFHRCRRARAGDPPQTSIEAHPGMRAGHGAGGERRICQAHKEIAAWLTRPRSRRRKPAP